MGRGTCFDCDLRRDLKDPEWRREFIKAMEQTDKECRKAGIIPKDTAENRVNALANEKVCHNCGGLIDGMET